MKIHEFQARQLLSNAGITVPPGKMVTTVEEAHVAARSLFAAGSKLAVVKAQVHAGGRGKAGFVKVVKSIDEALAAAKFMLGNRMKSPQTPPEGLEVSKLLIADAVEIAHEYYVAVLVDRANRTNTLIASAEGGVEIEKVAETRPDAIIRIPLDPIVGLQPFQAREVALALGFKGKAIAQAISVFTKLSALQRTTDASLVEVNPLVLTPCTDVHPDGQVMAIDAKFDFDDNALFRHSDIAAMHDPTEENAAEIRAQEFGLSYVALDGNIGCLVNGAGLAMSTMDIIKLHGGEPANFLDVGGSATEEAVTEAFRIILSDHRVKGVLVNIFGGIMQCDRIARAIVGAAKTIGFRVPLVVRLEGTNVIEARRILDEARANIPTMQSATDLTDAASKIVAAVAAEPCHT
ncbi:MAG: ADP-forming succinate--CoA ligase subunit beta [Planctomycetota bacterium]|nr:ADP-forming succinate--CoA ligase subunit beta [Planctomycetota bacterium]MDA1261301.1 ADP-forming succinate--CoA ligase subunit beta [Planctomycetota bacterium]